jgi:hypothetical protein
MDADDLSTAAVLRTQMRKLSSNDDGLAGVSGTAAPGYHLDDVLGSAALLVCVVCAAVSAFNSSRLGLDQH